MRVALLADGKSIHTVNWVNGLSRKGIDVTLISSHSISPDINGEVNICQLPFSSDKKLLSGSLAYILNVLPLIILLFKLRPNILHSHYLSGYGLLGALTFYRNFVTSVWGSDIYIFPKLSKVKHLIIKFVLWRTKKLSSTSRNMLKEVLKYSDIASRSTVIPFGIDTKKFKPILSDRDPSFVVGTVKGLKDVYGVDYLITAFFQVCEYFEKTNEAVFSELKLSIAGHGAKELELRQLANSSDYRNKVEFLGFIENKEVPATLSTFDVFIAYSRSESFGVSVLEASSSGLPVIVSDVGGLPEVVEQNKTGFVVPANSADLLAKSIITMFEDRKSMVDMGVSGVEFVEQNYSENASLMLMINFYKEFIREKK